MCRLRLRRCRSIRRMTVSEARPDLDLDDVLAQVAEEFVSGYVDEAEAVARLVDAGCTRRGAEIHVSRWA